MDFSCSLIFSVANNFKFFAARIVVVLVLTSVMGLYYYLRIISTLFAQSPAAEARQKSLHPFFNFAIYATLFILMVLICVLGVYPGPAVEGIREFLMIR